MRDVSTPPPPACQQTHAHKYTTHLPVVLSCDQSTPVKQVGRYPSVAILGFRRRRRSMVGRIGGDRRHGGGGKEGKKRFVTRAIPVRRVVWYHTVVYHNSTVCRTLPYHTMPYGKAPRHVVFIHARAVAYTIVTPLIRHTPHVTPFTRYIHTICCRPIPYREYRTISHPTPPPPTPCPTPHHTPHLARKVERRISILVRSHGRRLVVEEDVDTLAVALARCPDEGCVAVVIHRLHRAIDRCVPCQRVTESDKNTMKAKKKNNAYIYMYIYTRHLL